MELFQRFWHVTLGRPYRLAKPIDQGAGQAVVLLHGIGRTGQVWINVVERLQKLPFRIVAFDLLGFGASPKPDLDYSVDDHAAAVIAALDRLRTPPVILVGHSMGCLVAVHVARVRPDLVKHLVLYEMPLYEGLPNKRLYQMRINMYRKFYQRVMDYKPTFDTENARSVERFATKVVGIQVGRESWQPFIRSLRNTILKQTTAADIKVLQIPMDVIYGTFDTLVIKGKPQQTFGSDNTMITAHSVRARHEISPRASKFIVERIEVAEHPKRAAAKASLKSKVAERVKQAQSTRTPES